MAEVFPSSLIPRENPNLRLGIKSSLNSFRQIIASLFAIYTVADTPTDVAYSEEYSNNGKVQRSTGKRILYKNDKKIWMDKRHINQSY